jgi:hypothetical protein
MIIVVASVAGVWGLSALLVLALGRVAGRADRDAYELWEARRERLSMTVFNEDYAGFARAQSTITRDSLITVPSSSSNAGTQRSPVNFSTSERPLVLLKIPGSGAKP